MLDLFVEIAAGATDLADAWRVLVAKASTNVFMNPAAVAAAEGHGYADPRVLAAWDDGTRRVPQIMASRPPILACSLHGIAAALSPH